METKLPRLDKEGSYISNKLTLSQALVSLAKFTPPKKKTKLSFWAFQGKNNGDFLFSGFKILVNQNQYARSKTWDAFYKSPIGKRGDLGALTLMEIHCL